MKEIGVLKIKFENWNFEELFKNGNYENWFWKIVWELDFLKIKFKNWNENKIIWKTRILKIILKRICENKTLACEDKE